MGIMFWVFFLFFSWLFFSKLLKLANSMGFIFYVFLFVYGLLMLKLGFMLWEKRSRRENEARRIKGTVLLMRKHVLGIKDIKASVLNRIHEIFGFGISMQLISSVQCDPEDESRGKPGNVSYVEKWLSTLTSLLADETSFPITFEWDESMGLPGAILVKNYHHSEFFLKMVTLKDVPGHGDVNFVCDSWVYPVARYTYHRVFFSNKSYLPCEMPELLRHYREEELTNLRGDGTGELKEWDRVYDYAFYNDLGSPEKGVDYARPVLGGTKEYPYPRRGRTGRPIHAKNAEQRLPLLSLNIYVPCDERFRHLKFLAFLAYALKALIQLFLPAIATLWKEKINEFDSFDEVRGLYRGGLHLPSGFLHTVRKCFHWEFLRELLRSDGERFLKFPTPAVVKNNDSAWRTDEEFGRETLAGVNPVVIRRLEVFPPVSKLDVETYGDQHSSIKEEHVKKYIAPLSINEAIEQNKMFILDHHDAVMPYLSRINTTGTKTYATRTLLFLQENGTLKPLAIELSLPNPRGRSHGCVAKVFPAPEESTIHKKNDVDDSIWQLAKAYAAVNDSGYHQLISHWLNTHAVIEPFIIATNRQLSVVHPIYKLLDPHFLDTMNINALARQTLINAGGVLERTVFPGKFAMEMSSFLYKDWVFTDHALPVDLLKRGVAVEVETDPVHYPHGLKLLIPDYPFANDGLEIWFAIKTWVSEYCHLYYRSSNEAVQGDSELQSWWAEVRTKGHGDRKDATWWPTLDSLETLTETLTTIIWIASALHAAVNFGQYPYAGYLPNRPTVSRRFMPERGTLEFSELESDPDRAFLKTITARFQTLLGVSLIEVLSRQSAEEVYLGQRETPEWTADTGTIQAFERFRKKLEGIEVRIAERNRDEGLRNRVGPVKLPYTLLHPNTSNTTNKSTGGGLTGTGIPNSISI